MKILKKRNGIALMAVLVIMLITTLFIPVMFSMSDSSLRIAIQGTDRQRSSYLARTITEMSVASFKKFDSIEDGQHTPAQLVVKNAIDQMLAGEFPGEDNTLGNDDDNIIKTDVVGMFSTEKPGTLYYKVINGNETEISYADYIDLADILADYDSEEEAPFQLVTREGMVEDIVYANKTNTANGVRYIYNFQEVSQITNSEGKLETVTERKPIDITEDPAYTFIGEGQCTITYDGSTKYYRTDKTGANAGVAQEIDKEEYDALVDAYLKSISSGSILNYEVSVVNNKNVIFTSTATVGKSTSSRSCVLVLQSYPTEDNWFVFKPGSGGNQIFVDPKKATSTVPIDYTRAGVENYQQQVLLVYSSIGNMIITDGSVPDESGITHIQGNQNSRFVLGVEPGLNTTPNNDPTFETIDAVNYNSSLTDVQDNNFVAFASTKAIKVDLPINLLVNPCRANRLGDGREENGSLFKIMLFQAPDIVFEGGLDMMMSFYVRGTEEARRMSSVVLSAPSSSPYTYYHNDYKRQVKAGRVFFAEDSYLWIIPYGDDGSSSSWTGIFAETVYKRDSDFTKIKIANAGDVYYFNAEVEVDSADAALQPAAESSVKDVTGFSLTAYFLETQYIPNMQSIESGEWWQIWSNTKTAIFSTYMNNFTEEPTYVKDDFSYIGNVNDGLSNIEFPAVDEYYTVWTS